MLIARFGFLYGVGGSINTALQLIAVNIGLLNRHSQTIETVPHFVEAWVNIALPVLPPYTAVDILNVIVNLLLAGLIAFSWTVRWSESMYNQQSR